MKRWTTLILSLFLIVGCTAQPVQHKEWSQVYDAFNKRVRETPDPAMVVDILDRGAQELTPQEMTQLVYHYEALLLASKHVYKNRLFYEGNHKRVYAAFPDGYSFQRVSEIPDPEFRALMINLMASGYKLKREDGLYEPQLDYHFFQQYLDQMDEEGQRYIQLRIEIDNLLDYDEEKGYLDPVAAAKVLVKMDQFLLDFPNSRWHRTVSGSANARMLALVFGPSNDALPYDSQGMVKSTYAEAYKVLSEEAPSEEIRGLFTGVNDLLYKWDDYMLSDVMDFIYAYPEMYRKVYLAVDGEPDAQIDVGYGEKMGQNYYYPHIEGLSNKWVQKQLNTRLREISESGMTTRVTNRFGERLTEFWADFDVLYNRANWLSIYVSKYYTYDNGGYRKSVETLNYDFKKRRTISLHDILSKPGERARLNKLVSDNLNARRTSYPVDMDAFAQDINPEFLLTDAGIYLFIPKEDVQRIAEDYVQVFIPYEQLETTVIAPYEIYKEN